MSLLYPISKTDAQILEHSTTRIENLKNKMNLVDRLRTCQKQMDIQGWYHKYNLRPGYVREHWAKLTELFGFKPVYYVTHVCRNALWAFRWEGLAILVYQDQRGLAIQVEPTFPIDKVIPFMKFLKKLLNRGV